MIRRLFISVSLIVALLGGAGSAFADAKLLGALESSEGITAGPMKIHLGAQLGELFDSNVYSAPSDVKDDFITIVSPGVVATIKTQRNRLNLGFSSDMHSYNEYDDENYTATTARGSYVLTSLGGFSFSLSDNYHKTTAPRPEQSTPIRTKNSTNTANIDVEYEFPAKKFIVKASYMQFDLNYDEDVNSDMERRNKDISFGLYYRILPKTSILLEYVMSPNEYFSGTDTDADSKNHTTNVGLQWESSAKMTGDLKVGFQRRKYDNSTYTDQEDEMLSIDANLRYKITDSTKIKALLTRTMNETGYGGSTTLSESVHYKANTVGFGVSSRFMDKIGFDIDYALEVDYYNRIDPTKSKRKDDIHLFNISASYEFAKRFSADINYNYRNLDSDDPNNDEIHTLSTLNLKFMM
ncbi:outer membrane beta-barrel protein [Nitrospirota bacterium]